MTTPSTPSPVPAIDRDSLLLLLRERPGADKTEESFVPSEEIAVQMPDGTQASMTPAWFDLIGDLQVRFARETADAVLTLHASELVDLGLSADAAVAVALANLHRLHGEPTARPWHNLQRVGGRTEDADSAYFLDRAFWRAQLAGHPDGLVVAVPRIDLLLFAPMADGAAVDSMRRGVPGLQASAADWRLSSALYLFKDDRWRVLQPAAS